MYTKVLRAVKQRSDDDMLARLRDVPNGDLVDVEARYHRTKSCYAKYVTERNISAQERQIKKKVS